MSTVHSLRFQTLAKSDVGRERVRQACHRCRLKKLKCDGIIPCGRCIKDDMICQQRVRKGTSTEQSHAEYVTRLEEQQHILATALKLTWSRLHPEDADAVPSAHAIIARLRMLPKDPGDLTGSSSPSPTSALWPGSRHGRLPSSASSLSTDSTPPTSGTLTSPVAVSQPSQEDYFGALPLDALDLDKAAVALQDLSDAELVDLGMDMSDAAWVDDCESQQSQPVPALAADSSTVEPWKLMVQYQ